MARGRRTPLFIRLVSGAAAAAGVVLMGLSTLDSARAVATPGATGIPVAQAPAGIAPQPAAAAPDGFLERCGADEDHGGGARPLSGPAGVVLQGVLGVAVRPARHGDPDPCGHDATTSTSADCDCSSSSSAERVETTSDCECSSSTSSARRAAAAGDAPAATSSSALSASAVVGGVSVIAPASATPVHALATGAPHVTAPVTGTHPDFGLGLGLCVGGLGLLCLANRPRRGARV